MVVQELLESGCIHKTKETLVVTTGTVGNGGKTHKSFLLFLHAPNDRQNVSAVLNLVKSLKACIIFHRNSDDQVCCELLGSLKILQKIFDGIVCVFSSPKIHLAEQLRNFQHYCTFYITKHMSHHLFLSNFTMIYREWCKQVSIPYNPVCNPPPPPRLYAPLFYEHLCLLNVTPPPRIYADTLWA